jgi:hypothetical protein
MSAILPIVAALALCCAGMAGLCLAMSRHYEQVRGTRKIPPRWRTFSRNSGWVLLTVALVVCVKTWGAGIGVVTWCATLTAGAMSVIWLLPYSPRAASRLAAMAAGLGLFLVIWQFAVPAEL